MSREVIERIQTPIFLETVLTIEIAQIQFRRERQPKHLKNFFFPKNTPINFHINSISVIKLIKQNKLSFSSTGINKLLLVPVHSG